MDQFCEICTVRGATYIIEVKDDWNLRYGVCHDCLKALRRLYPEAPVEVVSLSGGFPWYLVPGSIHTKVRGIIGSITDSSNLLRNIKNLITGSPMEDDLWNFDNYILGLLAHRDERIFLFLLPRALYLSSWFFRKYDREGLKVYLKEEYSSFDRSLDPKIFNHIGKGLRKFRNLDQGYPPDLTKEEWEDFLQDLIDMFDSGVPDERMKLFWDRFGYLWL